MIKLFKLFPLIKSDCFLLGRKWEAILSLESWKQICVHKVLDWYKTCLWTWNNHWILQNVPGQWHQICI